MAHERKAIAARFSSSAATYHAMAAVQRLVAERLSAMLAGCGEPARILEIGCGTGLLTEHLCRLFSSARIDALDMAPGMVAQCRERLAGRQGLFCHAAGLEEFRAEMPYPLIVSSSALHWIHPPAAVMAALAGMLSGRGRLVFALMVRGTLAELQAARARAAPRKTPARSLPAAVEIRNALVRAGLRIEEEREENLRQEYASASDFLRCLHELGLTAGPLARSEPPLNRTDLRRLAQDYQARYRSGQGVYAGYKVAYFRARKNL